MEEVAHNIETYRRTWTKSGNGTKNRFVSEMSRSYKQVDPADIVKDKRGIQCPCPLPSLGLLRSLLRSTFTLCPLCVRVQISHVSVSFNVHVGPKVWIKCFGAREVPECSDSFVNLRRISCVMTATTFGSPDGG